MSTVAEIRALLENADEREFEVLSRALSADTRKGVRAALEGARRRLGAEASERMRVEGLYAFQADLAHGGLTVGMDEVGRGPLAGPLTVGAVVLPEHPRIAGLDDSKRLSPSRREKLADEVKRVALAWTVQHAEPAFIDEAGMARALRSTFRRALEAIERLLPGVDAVLIDGNPLHIDERETCIVKGDARCASIAAASIIAKVERDTLMTEYSREYPEYGFDSCKGYGSKRHMEAIRVHGLSPIHRRSFCHFHEQEPLF